LKASETVYWIKVALGIVNGVTTFFLQSYLGMHDQLVLMLGITLYIIYSEVLAAVFKVDRDRAIKIAIGGFLFLWMLTWTLLYTLGRFGWI